MQTSWSCVSKFLVPILLLLLLAQWFLTRQESFALLDLTSKAKIADAVSNLAASFPDVTTWSRGDNFSSIIFCVMHVAAHAVERKDSRCSLISET